MLKSKKTYFQEIISQGVVAGLTESAYIILVSIFLLATEVFFPAQSGLVIFGIVALVILFVLSAAISVALVFGYPVYYLINKQFKEALFAFIGTGLILFIVFALVLIVSVLTSIS